MEKKSNGGENASVSLKDICSCQETYNRNCHRKAVTNTLFRNSISAPAVTFVQASTARNFPKFSIDIPILFDALVYQAVILKKYLASAQVKALEKELISLHPRNPMGAPAD
jgi:aminopeptidase C